MIAVHVHKAGDCTHPLFEARRKRVEFILVHGRNGILIVGRGWPATQLQILLHIGVSRIAWNTGGCLAQAGQHGFDIVTLVPRFQRRKQPAAVRTAQPQNGVHAGDGRIFLHKIGGNGVFLGHFVIPKIGRPFRAEEHHAGVF